MVDNLPAARPHSGLASADVIYDVPAEGGITRLLAVFFKGAPNRVGPVRSTRSYFVYLAAEYGAALVHIGASPGGFQALVATGLVDVDEGRNGPGFTRDSRRYAPHNAFVDLQLVRQRLGEHGVDLTGGLGGLTYGTGTPPGEGGPASQIEIDYPGGQHYVVEYAYDPTRQVYLRSMDGEPHVDAASGVRYAARTVVVELVPVAPIAGDDKGRVDVGLVGSGNGFLARDGRIYPITWSKSAPSRGTEFTYADGSGVELARGQVWVQVAPLQSRIAAQ
jgi:hypothetical protein